MKPVFVIIDGNAIVHRSYHALPPLTTKDGTIVNAVYGFATTLLKVINELKPAYIAVTFDMQGPTFRDKIYEKYKATRVKADQELYDQIPLVHQLVEKFGIQIFEKQGFEADDVIGTIVEKVKKERDKVAGVIVTGDMDTLQLVDDKHDIKVHTMRKGISDVVVYDEQKVKERFDGLNSSQIVDLKALKGDASDNIPGVKGIGEKTAIGLLKEFHSLDKIYKTSKIKEGLREKLAKGEKDAWLSRELAQIKKDVPVEFELKSCAFQLKMTDELVDFLRKLEFHSLVNRLTGHGVRAKGALKKDGLNKSRSPRLKIVGKDLTFDEAEKILQKEDELAVALIKQDNGLIIAAPNHLFYFSSIPPFVLKCKLLIGHSLKNFLYALAGAGLGLKGKLFDTMIAAYLLSPGKRTYDAPTLVMQYLGVHLDVHMSQGSLFGTDAQSLSEELWHVLRLKDYLLEELKKINIFGLFEKIEMPLIPVLVRMEIAGVLIDNKKIGDISRRVEGEIEKVSSKIFEYAGEEFNINSSQQLREILYDKLGIRPEGIKKGKTGLSTAAPQLEKIWEEHPIIPLIVEHRELVKLKTTYIDVLPTLINPKTGRVHTHFNQAVTTTGRLSSSDPNLQNIPIRTPLGKEMRDAFVASKGNMLVVADYSQIELRIVASLADDKKMIEVFKRGQDIHKATAAAINGVQLKDVTDEMRRAAKEVNFGVLYGMGPHGLAMRTGLNRVAAAQFIEKYFRAFSGVKKYIDETIKLAREQGYVETLYGRRRYIPEVQAESFQLRSAGERMAVNLPVQGTAADLMKLAMIKVDKLIDWKNAKMILQVHDELVLEVKESEAENLAKQVKEAMESVVKLRVPVEVHVEIGRTWGEAKI